MPGTAPSDRVLIVDGSFGEGGGQILRSSLALSLVTGTPFRIIDIRKRRRRPGLRQQHLTAVRAAATIAQAELEGDEIGSQELSFVPRPTNGGEYTFSIGTAGSTTLVLQTILPALVLAQEKSKLVLEGGTHNPQSPTFEFLAGTHSRSHSLNQWQIGASQELKGRRLRIVSAPLQDQRGLLLDEHERGQDRL